MKIVYSTRSGNTETFVNKLGYEDTLEITDGSETVNSDYVLITYTDGYGEIPYVVEDFLQANNAYLKAVVGMGNKDYHKETFAFAADEVQKLYDVPVLGKVHEEGTEEDVTAIKSAIDLM